MRSAYYNWKKYVMVIIASILLCDCVEQYVSPYKSPVTGYLVVDGYIAGNGLTQYQLSRSIGLSPDSTPPAVTGAQLQVEGDDNSIYPLLETGGGFYSANLPTLNPSAKYRLRIGVGSDTYLSDYVPYKPTPPIDSVSWIQNSSGVNIYVSTHDPANATHYYRWTYDQTYEFHSAEPSELIYDTASNSVIGRTPAQQIYTCWHEIVPTDLVVGNSTKLSQDVIYEQPLVSIPANSREISVEYSILVTQYALSDSGYFFLAEMERISQTLGSIFDAQPSELIGNIHRVGNPQEPVIGFIQAGTIQQQRIFISNLQLSNWFYRTTCEIRDTVLPTDSLSLRQNFFTREYTPVAQNISGAYVSNYTGCIDCTTEGGTNQEPLYWPN